MEQPRYKIVNLLGKGRTGSVYEAEDTALGRKIAMRRFFDGDEENIASSEWEEQFLSITQELGNFQHPSIVTVYDAGVTDEGAFIITQLLKGTSLSQRIEDGPLKEWNVYEMVMGILEALDTVHNAGQIHGALSLCSVLRVERASGGYRNLLVDLGHNKIAPLIQGEEKALVAMTDFTMMAPELFEGKDPSKSSDIYAVGHLAYTCLIGGHPLGGMPRDRAETKHKESNFKALHEINDEISEEFSNWIATLMQSDPEKRPTSASDALSNIPKLEKPVDLEKISQVTTQVQITEAQTANQTTGLQTAAAIPRGVTTRLQPLQSESNPNTSTMLINTSAMTGSLNNVGAMAAKEEQKSNIILVLGICGSIVVLLGAAILLFGVMGKADNAEDIDDIDDSSSVPIPVRDFNDSETFIPDENNTSSSNSNQPIENPNQEITFGKAIFIGPYRHNIKNAPTVNIPITALHTVIIGGSLPPAIPKAKIQKVFTEIEVTPDVITDKSTTMRLVYPGLNTPRYQTAIEYSNEERSFLVRGIFPETEKSAINVRLLLSKRNSIFRVRVNGENVSISSSEDLDLKQDGSYSITVSLKNIKPNEPFKVVLTHVKPQSEELESSTLSLNSIIALPY